MKKQVLVTLLGAALALPLAAQAEGAYVGANIGRTEQKLNVDAAGSIKDKATGFKLYGGYDFTKNFGVEGGYVQFGTSRVSRTVGTDTFSISGKPRALYVAATGTLPLNDQFSLFAKAGVSANRTKYHLTGDGFSESDTVSETSVMFGIGAAYNFTQNLALVAEYENFGKVIKEDGLNLKADLISVGVRYKF